jgi:hypothetical protein
MALVRCIPGKFLGVVCHCFPPVIYRYKMFSALSLLMLVWRLILLFSVECLRLPVPVATRSKGWVYGHSLAGIVVSNPDGDMVVYLLWMLCVIRGLCDELITRPEKSYRLWCVGVRSWILDNEQTLAHWWLLRHGKKKSLKLLAKIGIDPGTWANTTVLPWRRDDCGQTRNYVFLLLQGKGKSR